MIIIVRHQISQLHVSENLLSISKTYIFFFFFFFPAVIVSRFVVSYFIFLLAVSAWVCVLQGVPKIIYVLPLHPKM